MLSKLAMTGVGTPTPTYVDDVFSAYTYTGTGASQNIQNGISFVNEQVLDANYANVSLLLDGDIDLNYSSVSLLLRCDGTNGSTTFTDVSSAPKTVTRFGSTTISTAQSKFGGSSISFNGTTDYLQTAAAATGPFDFAAGDFTAEGWIYPTVLGDTLKSIFAICNAGGTTIFALSINTSSRLIFTVYDGSTFTTSANSGDLVLLNQWSHVAISRSGTTIRLFLNGVLHTSTTFTGTITSPNSPFTIGRFGDWVTDDRYFDGFMDDIRITKGVARYTSNFIPVQIPAVAGTAFFTDNSPTPKTISATGTPIVSSAQSVFGGGSLFFNGTSDYLTCATSTDFDLGSTYTYEFWVYPRILTGNQMLMVRGDFQSGNWTSGGVGFGVRLISGNTLRVYFFGTTGASEQYVDIANALSVETWRHVAVVRSGTSGSVYIDGVLRGSISSLNTNAVNTQPVRIGFWSPNAVNEYFSGYIDDLRITKGVARYTGNFTLWSNQDPYYNNTSLLLSADTDPSYANVSLLLRCDGTNGSTTFTDTGPSPKTVTGTGNAQISTAQSMFGGASLLLDGNGDYLSTPSSTDFHFGSGDFTIECWARFTTIPTGPSVYRPIVCHDNVNVTRGWLLLADGDSGNKVGFGCFSGSTNFSVQATTVPLINTWNHYAVVRNGTLLSLYQNGVLQSTTIIGTATLNSPNIPLVVGSLVNSGTISTLIASNFNGHIDDLRITKGVARYTSNFVPRQIHGSNNSTIFVDSSPTPKTITAVGNAVVSSTQSKFGNASMYFDGNGDYLSVSSSTDLQLGTGDFTIELWANTNTYTQQGANSRTLFLNDTAGNACECFYYIPTGAIMFGPGTLTGTSNAATGVWNHVAITRQGTSLRLFVNGIQEAVVTNSTNMTGTNWIIGAASLNNGHFLGYIDDLRITKGVARYTTNFTPPTQSFSSSIAPITNASFPDARALELSRNPGMVWTKTRTGINNHVIQDTINGPTVGLVPNVTSTTYTGLTGRSFNANGFTLNAGSIWNGSGQGYASWTFRTAPKFLDIVSYTGDGVSMYSRLINHSLGVVPGFVILKRTDGTAGSWETWCRLDDTNVTSGMVLEANTANQLSLTLSAHITTTQFRPTGTNTNLNGVPYIAYVFAHDPSPDGLIQCGSFVTDASGFANVTLGWEPQFVIWKCTSTADIWMMHDTSRGMPNNGSQALISISTGSESSLPLAIYPNATGFRASNNSNGIRTYFYMAIRRSNKPPTTGTQVYNAIARTGTGAAATVTGAGFPPDWVVSAGKNGFFAGSQHRLTGPGKILYPGQNLGETNSADSITAFTMDGFNVDADATQQTVNLNTAPYINWCFERAPGVYDTICYTGTGANTTQAHNLTAAPEFMLVKLREFADWRVYHKNVGAGSYLVLNSTAVPVADATAWNSLAPTATVINLGSMVNTNNFNSPAIAHLFATRAGVSMVGTYTGNGSSQTINCGFTAGARFVMIKRTDAAGDWYVWDTVRGIVAANDPHLSWNSNSAEVTTNDSIDPGSTGFIVNQVAATNVNVTSATYIYLAIS